MKNLMNLVQKKSKYVVGLMSGTSVDGIDAALVKITGSGPGTRIKLVDFITSGFPQGFKDYVLKNSQTGSSDVADICKLNFLIAQLYAEAINQLCAHSKVPIEKIDLIGSHGQTIHHLPQPEALFGKQVRSTLQIGDPSVLAKLTGVITVGDFRVGDVALGGQGAPLVPYFDFLLFRSSKFSRALLNIGGISNITLLPKSCSVNDVRAFDTGPGNMLIDQFMKILYNKEYDEDGHVAKSGKVNEQLLSYLMSDEFVNALPPKSTGRERYGKYYVSNILSKFKNIANEDIVATATEFTAKSIFVNYDKYLKPISKIDELFVSGGGAHNQWLLNRLEELFKGVNVRTAEEIGISSDAKEAVCFAVLANETISGNPSNIPLVTGASRSTILGKICLP